ncbi:helix-turn-helix domain-containing protein [Gluconobacter cerinus]|uniref:helix-turn-helix domain-containing protein n=1 Tax=Gluconobacter cerinus TaxID=38307 RepID=UPI0020136406|nr:AraC family transcriptional regulator [Gluconobacter cerinus]
MKAAGQVHHFQARDLIMARTSAESFTFENSAEFSALEIHVPLPLLEQMQIEHLPRIQRRSLELQDPALKTAKQLFGYLRTIPAAQSPEALVGYGLAMTMLGYAFTAQKTARSQLTAKTIYGLENARKALLARLDQAPTIPQLAALCDLSPTRFKELFSRQYGCGPYTLYQSHRMEYARSLLERLNVTETAMELGYSNVSHFSAAFQRKFGYLPSRVKQLHSCK